MIGSARVHLIIIAASVATDPSEIVVPQCPFGGPGGVDAFYDGVGDIVQITVTYSDLVVYSVQTTYQQGVAKFMTDQHGKCGPSTFRERSYTSTDINLPTLSTFDFPHHLRRSCPHIRLFSL